MKVVLLSIFLSIFLTSNVQAEDLRLAGPFEWAIQELREHVTEVPYCQVSLISGDRANGRSVLQYYIEIDGRISELRILSLRGLEGSTGQVEHFFGRIEVERFTEAFGLGRAWYRTVGDDLPAFTNDLLDSGSLYISTPQVSSIRYELPMQNLGEVLNDAIAICSRRPDDAARRVCENNRTLAENQCYASCDPALVDCVSRCRPSFWSTPCP